MDKHEVIAKTLRDMRGYHDASRDEYYANCPDLDEYDRTTTIPELMQRLPDGDILTCVDLNLQVECCESCHHFYDHYDMSLIDLPDGRKAWICCAVRRALFHAPDSADGAEVMDIEEALSGSLTV